MTIPDLVLSAAIRALEGLPVPDTILRAAIRNLIGRRPLATDPSRARDSAFAEILRRQPVALHPEDANAQHYEIPAEFFGLVLGPRRKYSCCYYPSPDASLEAAELAALAATVERAGLADRHQILELGCGWGSLTLYMAERFPNARITAVSNSRSQRAFIEAAARDRGLSNVRVLTEDMNVFQPEGRFDRIVSVEMFEHMANWDALLRRLRGALTPEGRLFLHVFAHRATPYRFDHTDPSDWIAQHFFTGGIMPSEGLIESFDTIFRVEQSWRWSGSHYSATATHWLRNFDANAPRIRAVLADVYGRKADLWFRRWRLFFLATEGLFGYREGRDWGVMHYLLAPSA